MSRNIITIAFVLVLAATLIAQEHEQVTTAAKVNQANIAWNVEAYSQLVKPVERVNGTILTQQDLLREMYAIFPYAKQHNGFPKAMEPEIRRGALMMITFEELVYQEAVRRKLTITPERLAKAERQFQKNFESPQKYQQFLLTEANGSRQLMRNKIRRSLLIEDLLKAEVESKSKVTAAQARNFYQKHRERYQIPELFALQTITIMPPAPGNPKQTPPPLTPEQWKRMKARAEDALRQAKQTKTYEEFGMLAEKISEDDYRVMMGDHHPLPAAQLPAEILQSASKLQAGQISGVIEVDRAFTIIRLNSRTAARTKEFGEVCDALRLEMEHKKSEQLRHELDARLRKNANIEIIGN